LTDIDFNVLKYIQKNFNISNISVILIFSGDNTVKLSGKFEHL